MPSHQLSLTLIRHEVENTTVEQRPSDGYINATAMCSAAGKSFDDYQRFAAAYINELQLDLELPAASLVQLSRKRGSQDAWVHPQVAIHLGQWLSPRFAVQVTKWVHEWMSGKDQSARLPYHLERHMLNSNKIPVGYFSVLQEMTLRLVAPMEAQGYRMPENVMPDISQAKLLCKHLRERHRIDTATLPKYRHTFPDGREVDANLYPLKYLGDFHVLMAETWMPQKAAAFFGKRDPAALIALDKVLKVGVRSYPSLGAGS